MHPEIAQELQKLEEKKRDLLAMAEAKAPSDNFISFKESATGYPYLGEMKVQLTSFSEEEINRAFNSLKTVRNRLIAERNPNITIHKTNA